MMQRERKILKIAKEILNMPPKERISAVRKFPANTYCNDCKSTNPTWTNLNFGVLLCTACAGRHRENKNYKVKSLLFDKISDAELTRVLVGGNGDNFEDGEDISKYKEMEWYVDEITERAERINEEVVNFTEEVPNVIKDEEKKEIRIKKTLETIKGNKASKIGSKSIEDLKKTRKIEKDKETDYEKEKPPVVKEKKKVVKKVVERSYKPTVIALERGSGTYTFTGDITGDIGLLNTNIENKNEENYNYKNIKFHSAKKKKSVVKKMTDGGKNVVSGLLNKFNK